MLIKSNARDIKMYEVVVWVIVLGCMVQVCQGTCSYSTCYNCWNSGSGTTTCYENNAGSFITCSSSSYSYLSEYYINTTSVAYSPYSCNCVQLTSCPNTCYNSSCDCYNIPCGCYNYWSCQTCYHYQNVVVYRKCHDWCLSCNGQNNPTQSCPTCKTGYYRYYNQNRCNQYCPSAGVSASGYTASNQGQYFPPTYSQSGDANQCQMCNVNCAVCKSSAALTDCYSCTGTYRLIGEYSTCISHADTSGAEGPQGAEYPSDCYDIQCISACPSHYYFFVPQATVNAAGSYYQAWSNADSVTLDSYGSYTANYRRLNQAGVCYLCDSHCLSCVGPYQNQCTMCKRYNYKQNQYTGGNNYYCSQRCIFGTYDGVTKGEYIRNSTNTATNHLGVGKIEGQRICQLCDVGCRWCKDTSSTCYQCTLTYFLIDLKAECQARFLTPGDCPTCNATNMCNTVPDKTCSTSCPTYYYFKTYLQWAASDLQGTNHTRYTQYRTGAQSKTTWYLDGNDNAYNTSGIYYRAATNLCMLCDFRCIQCTGPLNSNCSLCRNNYYKWTHKPICDNYCPGFQWISSTNTCDNCDVNCRKCEGSYLNCSECRGSNYAFYNNGSDPITAFLYTPNSSQSRCMTVCPTEPTDYRTKIGYYGSFLTLTCLPCPSPCSNCNIQIIRNNYPTIACSDIYCSNGLVCTNCLTGYEVVGGKCITQNSCRQYSYYVQPSVSAVWSAVDCKCLDGYSSSPSAYAKCDIRCHITCKTCTGTSNTQCSSCYDGAKLSSSQCVLNSTSGVFVQEWYPSYGSSGVTSPDYTTYSCGGVSTYFGYLFSSNTKSFRYGFTIPSLNYYSIRVKIGLLLVDQYNTRGAFYLSRDTASNTQIWSWNYNTKGAYGQMLCGNNKMDYVLFATAELPTRNQTSENFYITSNEATLQTNGAGALHWGVYGIYVSVLKCDAACTRCTGPAATDCIVCATTQTPPEKISVNGKCVCNTASGYYQWADGTCNIGCPAGPTNPGWFRDSYTRKCVHPPDISNCTAPQRFGDSMGTSGYGTCVQVCPPTYYATMKKMKCTQDCYTDGPGQYKFDGGASRSCQDICPSPYVKDILNRKCVLQCPSGYYLQLQNRSTDPTCILHCVTGWEYVDLQQCVQTCPNGYFKQIDASGYRKCVQTCVNAFGNVDTNECTLSCPFPRYADDNNRLCVDQCSRSGDFMQVAVSNLNRTCVGTCQNGQYGNPFTKKCSNYTTECPDGYFADNYLNINMCVANCTGPGYVAQNSTKKCQTSCTTGFAHWPSKACVSICPTNQGLFGYITGKVCVSSCNATTQGLYGDAQANRTCVTTCTASPQPTFGQNTTSKCVDKCTGATQFGDPGDPYRRCVADCSGVPQRYADSVSKLCVLTCPDTYFAQIDPNNNNRGRCVQACLSPNFGDPQTNTCRAKCKIGYWGDSTGNRLCVKQCPRYYFGKDPAVTRVCVLHTNCGTGYFGDIDTGLCINNKSLCSNNTYADLTKQLCVLAPNCTQTTFADPFTKGCQISCSNGYYADNNINTCVAMCSDVYDEYGQWGKCMYTCDGGRYIDAQANRTCVRNCSRSPLPLFGITSGRLRCVQAKNCPSGYFGDNITLTCVNPCNGSSTLPFGDSLTRTCVIDCPDGYYGDKATHLCVQKCNFATYHYADNQTGNCQTLCTLGTFGVNASSNDAIPSCEYDCPDNSYARDNDRICVADCQTGLFGDPITRICYSDPFSCSDGYFANDVSHKCVKPVDCQTVGPNHYFAQNSTKTCVQMCDDPNYGDSQNWYCVPKCNSTSYGENTTNLCLSNCIGYSAYAQNQNNLCVARCSNTPVKHYAQDSTYTCVQAKYCPIIGGVQTYARNFTQKCQLSCPTGEWADPTTLRCVQTCPNAYYADNSSGLNICTSSCPDGATYRFRDNSTKSCVTVCPASNGTFGYILGDACVYTCPPSYFAQVDADRLCVNPCKDDTWGNKITRVCITQPLTQCPTGTWADNFTNNCQQVCDSGSGYYGYNVTKLCVTACPSPTFAWDGSRVCIDICPASLTDSGYFGDSTTTPTRKCFQTCQGPNLYRDPAASRTCQLSCTYNTSYKTYKDPTTMSCEAHCSSYPSVRYADDNLKSCELSCAGSLKKDDTTRKCVSTCPYLYDPTTDKCVDKCPTQSTLGELFANLTSNNNTCIVASSCPTSTWADSDSRTCASSCPSGTYKYDKYCVSYCPNDYFIDTTTQSCVTPANCPTSKFADNQTRSCVSQCVGTYGDSTLRRCIDVCYGTKYGDPYTHTCQTNCSNNLRINTLTRTCQANCVIGTYNNPATGSCSSSCSSPYYADNTTMACVTACSANPMTFASVSSSGARECVGRCDPSKMHDMVNRICVATNACPTNTYSYSINMSCVSFCPGPSHYQLDTACVTNCSSHATLKYSDDVSRKCVATCPTGSYKDTLSYKCVTACPTAPIQYFISASQNKCAPTCPQGTYADLQQLKCVASCSLSPPMYAQQVNNICVQTCPAAQSSFADATTGNCVTSCPSGYFADSRDRKCKTNCSFLFADSMVVPKACVQNCTTGSYADQLTFTCVSSCPPNYYKHVPTKRCVQFCPYGYFLNPLLSLCVVKTNCPSTLPYADNYTRKCTSSCVEGRWGYVASGTTTGGDCRNTCPSPFLSNPLTGKCQMGCPTNFFADTDNNTCKTTCSYDRFTDTVNKKCQIQCPSANNLFADLYNRSCVTSCDPAKFTYADTLTRRCQITCTGNQYADDVGQKCVAAGACSSGKFSDPYYKKCVSVCYNNTYGYLGRCIPDCPTSTANVYASEEGRLCVTATNCPNGTFGDPILHKCVQFCPIESGTFADYGSKKCVPSCSFPLFADNLTRECVDICPNVSKMYGDTVNNKCVHFCLYPYFADETTNLCKTGCPNGYFADSSTRECVKKCPQGKYGNNVSNTCDNACPSTPEPYFGDPDTRGCVLYCPQGKYADKDHNRQCQPKCTGNVDTYGQNTTNMCVGTCLTGYSNIRTKQCIGTCTSGFYGYNRVCYEECPRVSPIVFADNTTHLCVETCPDGTYGDLFSLKCVKICPISRGTFADTGTKRCVGQCPGSQYANPANRKCVSTCPQVPAMFGKLPQKVCVSQCTFGLYANNATRLCESGCPFGTYADNTTMKCQPFCPRNPLHFGENITNKCIKTCWADRNMYADDSTGTCVYYCASGTFADSTTRKCVNTCPSGYYALNRTGTCEQNCDPGTFADTLLRICVSRCSVNPIYYGDTGNHICVPECPPGSYGNPLNQECAIDSGGASTCPSHYYADPRSKLCVQVCPAQYDLYSDPNTKKCEPSCSGALIADNSTMRCVDRCPQYPSSYADLDDMRCIFFCPDGTFADDISRTCVGGCPSGSYSDNSTNRCVSQCPQQPLTYADDTTWECVTTCPQGLYADNSTLKCVPSCPAGQGTFAENTTNQCVRVCPPNSYGDSGSGYCVSRCYGGKFSDVTSRLCVSVCPKYPPLYADSSTDRCVDMCPPWRYAYQRNRTCVIQCPLLQGLYRQNTTLKCVSRCNSSYADNFTGYCVTRCSVDSWADPTIRVCVGICPDQPLMYADNTSQSCVTRCPGSTFGQNSTRACVNTCPTGSLSLPQNNLCVRYCPIGYFADNATAFCYSQCTYPLYGDPSTRSCVLTCPLNQLLFADNSSRQCVKYCPPNSYADKKSVECVGTCPTADSSLNEIQTYAADYNNVCVQECALPYYAYLPTKKCVATCPNPHFNDIKDHKCKLCPSLCTGCTSLDYCTGCVPSYYIENGQCVQTCSSGYYANTALMKCVSSKLCKPNYGINSTHSCSATCPAGSYRNTNLYRCDACQAVCLTCTSWTYCLTCNTTISVMYSNFCHRFCEIVDEDANNNTVIQPYYSVDNLTCVQTCPPGTYLVVVYCKTCAAQCQTCSILGTNCTRCSDGLYLQNQQCVSACSASYKPTTTRNCVYCGTTCGDSLSFNTNITQIDGQNTIFITFTDNITVNGDPNTVFGLQQATGRRLLAAGYTIVIVDSKTIKIILQDQTDASKYTVKILKPQNVQDIYGNLPAKVRDQVEIDLSNTYTTSVESASANFSTYFAVISMICVVSFLFDIEFMKFLQLLFVHYFVVMILPPQLSKVLLAFRYSTLYYLPTMYPVPDVVLKETVTGKIFDAVGDYAFLRNGGFALTPLAIILVIWIILKILSVPEINTRKNIRMWCKQQLDEKFQYAVLIEWLSIMYLNSIFFIFMQMRDYTKYDAFYIVSIILAHIFLFLIAICFVYLSSRVITFFREYPKLSYNLKKATDLLLQESEYQKLNSTNIFLFEMKKIDLRNLYYPKINNENILPFRNIYRFSFIPLCCIHVTYLRATILSVILVFGTSTLMQMAMCIPLNVATLLYFIRARPFSFKYKKKRIRNYIAIYHQVALIVFELMMLALGILDRDLKSSFQKEGFANYIIYYLCAVCSVSFLYFLFRVGVQLYRRIWMPFTETELFRVNFPEKYKQLHGDKEKNLLKGVDPKSKQALRALIKGYKKERSSLRPNEQEKQNSLLPMKYKVTYFDRDASSIGTTSSMSKAQKRKMLKQIFQQDTSENIRGSRTQLTVQQYEEVQSAATEPQFEEYQQQIEIKVKDLQKYVKNAKEILRVKKLRQQQFYKDNYGH